MESPLAQSGSRIDEVLKIVIDKLQWLGGTNYEVTPDTSLVEFERETGSSLLMLELRWELEEQLAFYVSDELWLTFIQLPGGSIDWKRWEKEVAPKLTVRAFAEFIDAMSAKVSFEPISLLGASPCPVAGYFIGMTTLVQQMAPATPRFGPSTPIRNILKSRRELRLFWKRLERTSGLALPHLSFWLIQIADVLLVVSTGYLLFGVMINWAFLATFWILLVKCLLVCQTLYQRVNPMPRGILTFGDLARHLAGRKVNWV